MKYADMQASFDQYFHVYKQNLQFCTYTGKYRYNSPYTENTDQMESIFSHMLRSGTNKFKAVNQRSSFFYNFLTFSYTRTHGMSNLCLLTCWNNRICLIIAYFFRKFKTPSVKIATILRLRIWNFQCIVFIWQQTYRAIFKPALVYMLTCV